MYLYRVTNPINAWENLRDQHPDAVVKVEGMGIDTNRVSEVHERVAYWRKANAVHKWFVQNVQDGVDECQLSQPVDLEKLAGLVATCKEILADHSKADQLLTTEDGFFFGGTEYDEWYFDGLQQTVDQLEPLIAQATAEASKDYFSRGEFRYQSSW
jgi:hypothetical protein